MKDCNDCQHSYRDRDAVFRCRSEAGLAEVMISTMWNSRCHLMRLPEWPCGPEAKYYKDKRDI
jgi:hypothetical protein